MIIRTDRNCEGGNSLQKGQIMKNKILSWIPGTTVCSALFISGLIIGRNTTYHEYSNIATYIDGVLVDEDGHIFQGEFDAPDHSVVYVTYDNKGTVTRLDDEPIDVEFVEWTND